MSTSLTKLPKPLQTLPEREKVVSWWQSLSPEIRSELTRCYREESKSFRFERLEDFNEFETEVAALFEDDFYEYLVNHEFINPFKPKTFHVCTAHPKARAVQVDGVLPADFVCPFAHDQVECPMRSILESGAGQALILFR